MSKKKQSDSQFEVTTLHSSFSVIDKMLVNKDLSLLEQEKQVHHNPDLLAPHSLIEMVTAEEFGGILSGIVNDPVAFFNDESEKRLVVKTYYGKLSFFASEDGWTDKCKYSDSITVECKFDLLHEPGHREINDINSSSLDSKLFKADNGLFMQMEINLDSGVTLGNILTRIVNFSKACQSFFSKQISSKMN